jgi:hypothetical protein
VARLSLIFSHSSREIADGLQYSNAHQVRRLNNSIYKKLFLNDILEGKLDPADLITAGPVLRHFREAQARMANPGLAVRDKATLAFHLLTVPDIYETGCQLG